MLLTDILLKCTSPLYLIGGESQLDNRSGPWLVNTVMFRRQWVLLNPRVSVFHMSIWPWHDIFER